jgi:putative FmdB family regulatory protein
MPLFEFFCDKDGSVNEHYLSSHDKPNPPCDHCGGETMRVISGFNVVFTGPITKKYNDPNADNAHVEGHWSWETKGPGGEKIKPRPVFIDSFQAQREFCRREGLVNPKDIGPVEVGSDGKSSSSRGMPGCW